MTESEKVLYDQIFLLSFKYPVQHLWSAEHFERVVHEYKRYLLLTLVSEQQVAPSSAILKVKQWDLECTRSLWNQMHDEVGRDVTNGVSDAVSDHVSDHVSEHVSEDVFDNPSEKVPHYLNTLEIYHRMFGEPAPDDVWPKPIHRDEIADEPYTDRMLPAMLIFFCMVAFVFVSWGKAIYDSIGNDSYPLIISVFLGFGFLIWRSARIEQQCPSCKKYDALTKTGFMFAADPPKKQLDEHQCTHCTYKLWRPYLKYDGGGGGG
ncbi:MAG: hypothetical protein QE278_04545 [Limnobacter sp.]|nr:hypothetical protein [Limnobacter sp.]